MMVHICREEAEDHNLPLNSTIYTCGSCSVTFTTICTLHDHILDYELGGSFYYDGFTQTAFPKHRTATAETQTGWKDRQEARDIFRRVLDREFGGKQKYERVRKDETGNVCYHVRAKDINHLKKTVKDRRFHQLAHMCLDTGIGKDDNPIYFKRHNEYLKAKKRNQSKVAYSSESDASFESENEADEMSRSEDEDFVEKNKTSIQASTSNETEYESSEIPQTLQLEHVHHKEQFKETNAEIHVDNYEATKTDAGLNTGIIQPDPNEKIDVIGQAPLDKNVQIKCFDNHFTLSNGNHLRYATKSELDIDADLRVGEYSDNECHESDREYVDFLDGHTNNNVSEITDDTAEGHQDIMKKRVNELEPLKTEANSLIEATADINTEQSVNQDHVMVKTNSVKEHSKQNNENSLDNTFVTLKLFESTKNDTETLKNNQPIHLFLARKIKTEKRNKDMTLMKKRGRPKTQPVLDPLSREPKEDIEDKFFKNCAAQETVYDEKRKELVEAEEIKVAEKRTVTRNKPRKSYHYSSTEEESDELDEEVLAMRKERDISLAAQKKIKPIPEEVEDPTFRHKKKKNKVTDEPKPKEKRRRLSKDHDTNEDNDGELRKTADGGDNQADTSYTCNICQETMKISMKNKHKTTHKRVICYVCGLSLQHFKLDDHIRTKHGSGETPFTCEICGKGLQTKSQLYTHKRYAHTVGKHKCKYCERTFVESSQARIHMKRIHTGEKNHLCPHCGMAFFTATYCVKHVNIVHLKIHPYECEK